MTEVPESFSRLFHTNMLLTAAAVGLGTALTADQVTTYSEYRRQATRASVSLHDRGADTNIYTLPGCRTNVAAIEPMLESAFGKSANTAYIAYPARRSSVTAIGKALLEARRDLGVRDRSAVYGHSMGGLVLATLFEDDEFRKAFGPVDALVLDSSPSSIHDVRRGPRLWLEAATAVRFSRTFNLASREVMTRQAQRRNLQHAASVTDAQANSHQLSTARTPLYTIASQGWLIRRGSAQGLSRATDGGQVYYLEGPGRQDEVVNTDQAYAAYNQALAGRLERVIDPARPIGSHAAGPEYPEVPSRLLNDIVV